MPSLYPQTQYHTKLKYSNNSVNYYLTDILDSTLIDWESKSPSTGGISQSQSLITGQMYYAIITHKCHFTTNVSFVLVIYNQMYIRTLSHRDISGFSIYFFYKDAGS